MIPGLSAHPGGGFSWIAASTFLMAASCVAAFAWALAFHEFSILLFFVVFGAMGLLITDPLTRVYFMLAYACNILFALAWGWYQVKNGSGFFYFSDEQAYYTLSRSLAEDFIRGSSATLPSSVAFPGYFYLNAGLFFLAERVGDMSPVILRISNAFAGALIAPAVYHLARRFESEKKTSLPHQSAVLCALFPVLIYFSGMGLRDIWITSMTLWILRFQVRREEKMPEWIASIAIILLVLGIGMMRTFSLLPIAAFFAYLLLASRNSPFNLLAKTVVFLSLPAAAVWIYESMNLGLLIEIYTEQLLDHSSEGSLGSALLRLPEGIKEAVLFCYTVFFPVPPVHELVPASLFVGIGNVIWYAVVPVSILGMVAALKSNDRNAKLCKGLIVMVVATMLGVALITIDLRHKLQAYPVALIFCVYALHHASHHRIRQVLLAMMLVGANLLPLYLFMKIT